MANFMSDNCSGISPEVMQALITCNEKAIPSYGSDDYTAKAKKLFSELFETPVTTVFVATGTAANCLALSLFTPSYGAILCHSHSHIYADEYGAPGLFTGGAQLITVEGKHGKIEPDLLTGALRQASTQLIKPTILSLSQASESGTVYNVSEIAALTGIAKKNGLKVHMDGARFANALAHTGCSPAEMTWKLGVDVLSFGGTKNGCLAAEAVIVFNDSRPLRDELQLRRKKSGHTLSKMRFISSQFIAYLQEGLWLQNASHANSMARYLAETIKEAAGLIPLHPVEANEVFIMLPPDVAQRIQESGHQFFDWYDGSYRFVTSCATTKEDVITLIHSLENCYAELQGI